MRQSQNRFKGPFGTFEIQDGNAFCRVQVAFPQKIPLREKPVHLFLFDLFQVAQYVFVQDGRMEFSRIPG
jgi:hypothetical protein